MVISWSNKERKWIRAMKEGSKRGTFYKIFNRWYLSMVYTVRSFRGSFPCKKKKKKRERKKKKEKIERKRDSPWNMQHSSIPSCLPEMRYLYSVQLTPVRVYVSILRKGSEYCRKGRTTDEETWSLDRDLRPPRESPQFIFSREARPRLLTSKLLVSSSFRRLDCNHIDKPSYRFLANLIWNFQR